MGIGWVNGYENLTGPCDRRALVGKQIAIQIDTKLCY